MRFRIKIPSLLFLSSLLLSGPAGWGQGIIDIPGIERSLENPTFAVAIEADDSQISAMARRAFQVHGAFNVVPREAADVTVRMDRVATNRIGLSLLEGSGNRVLQEAVIAGPDFLEAIYRACDRVVESVSGLPGIFGGKLAFVGEGTGFKEIYVGDLFFQQYRALTRDRSESISPRWSPDGNRILYTGFFRSGFPEIYVLDTVSRSREVVARFRGTNTGGNFSPDGSRMAMILSSPGNPELYLANRNGKRPVRHTFNNSLEASPDFSPRGDRLVLTSDPMGVAQLYVMSVNGRSRDNGGMRRIARNVSGNCSEPAWNPRDENLIAFTLLQGGNFQIGLYDFEADSVEVLTQGGTDSVEPAWTQDGRHLIYTRKSGKKSELRILDTVSKRSFPLHTARVGKTSQASYVYP